MFSKYLLACNLIISLDCCIMRIGKLALCGQDVRKAGYEFVEAINVDPTHFGAYKCT